MRCLKDYRDDVALMIMAPPEGCVPPPDLSEHVFAIGFPTDAELAEVIRDTDAGISVSRWEGFNMPLAELQQAEKPVFAFNLAAHPEVVVAPDQLCADADEMAYKLYQSFRAEGAPTWARPAQIGPWRRQFGWERFMNDFNRIVEEAA